MDCIVLVKWSLRSRGFGCWWLLDLNWNLNRNLIRNLVLRLLGLFASLNLKLLNLWHCCLLSSWWCTLLFHHFSTFLGEKSSTFLFICFESGILCTVGSGLGSWICGFRFESRIKEFVH